MECIHLISVTQNSAGLQQIITLILQRYIYREILQKFLSIAGLLLLIFVSKYYVEYLADAASGKISTHLVFSFLWLKILATLPKMLPISLFLSVILAFSRLIRDNELVIFHSSGAGRPFEITTTLRFALVFTLFFSIIVLYFSPWAEKQIALLKSQAKQDSDITGITAGRFKEFSKGDRVVYIEGLSTDKQSMENIFLQVRQNNQLGVLTSDKAQFQWDDERGNRYIVFRDGQRYVGSPGMKDYQITDYESYAVLIETSSVEQESNVPPRTLSSSELLRSDQAAHQAELQWRVSLIISCLLLAMLGVILNSLSWTDKQYILILSGMLIYFIYSNLMGISRTLLGRAQLSSYIGLWWVHLLLIGLIVILYHWQTLKRLNKQDKSHQIISAEQ